MGVRPFRAESLPRLSLLLVDRCFYRGPGLPENWPVPPYPSTIPLAKTRDERLALLSQPSGIRGSLNEPRGPLHIGVDVETGDSGPVYAMRSGPVSRLWQPGYGLSATTITIGDSGAALEYWHLRPRPELHVGQQIERGELIGHVLRGFWHVHITEWYAACGGRVDPRRPAGPLHDPFDRATPDIGPLSGYVADWRAFAPLKSVGADALRVPDRAERMMLTSLSGVVDLRSDVSVMPTRTMKTFEQLPLAPAAIRAYLAPRGQERVALGPVFVYNGVRLLSADAGLWHLWAHGTYRSNSCFFHPNDPDKPCGFRMSYHVGGPYGFDTTRVRNGKYLYCVEALGDNNLGGRRCTPVTISN